MTLNLDLNAVGNLKGGVAFAQFGDASEYAAGGDDLVTLGQCRNHGLVFLGAFGLRPDQQEVERNEHHHQHHDGDKTPALLRGRIGGLGIGIGNKEAHGYSLKLELWVCWWNGSVTRSTRARQSISGTYDRTS